MESRPEQFLPHEDNELAILRRELDRERRRNADLTEENNVLRNTLAFYINGPRRDTGSNVNSTHLVTATDYGTSTAACSAQNIKQRSNASGIALSLPGNSELVRDPYVVSANKEITAVKPFVSNGLPKNPYETFLVEPSDDSNMIPVEEPDSNSTCRRHGYSGTQMAQAIRLCQNGELSLTKAAEMFGIPRSTLRSKFNDPLLHPFKKNRCSRFFTDDEENHIVDLITKTVNPNIPFNLPDLKRVVLREAQKKGKDFKFSPSWCHGFKMRHPYISDLLSGAKSWQSVGARNTEQISQ